MSIADRKRISKFTNLRDAYNRASAGDEGAQRCIIGCLENFGCDHLALKDKSAPKTVKWARYYAGLMQYIGSLVGEYGQSETAAEREVLAELNQARTYSDKVELTDKPEAKAPNQSN